MNVLNEGYSMAATPFKRVLRGSNNPRYVTDRLTEYQQFPLLFSCIFFPLLVLVQAMLEPLQLILVLPCRTSTAGRHTQHHPRPSDLVEASSLDGLHVLVAAQQHGGDHRLVAAADHLLVAAADHHLVAAADHRCGNGHHRETVSERQPRWQVSGGCVPGRPNGLHEILPLCPRQRVSGDLRPRPAVGRLQGEHSTGCMGIFS